MKYLIFVLLLTFFATTKSHAALQFKAVCDEEVEGTLVQGMFDTAMPIFSAKMGLNSEKFYLTKDTVCGQPVNFANSCRGELKLFQGDIGYFFECTNGIKGEAVSSAEELTFSCTGAEVEDTFKHTILGGCKGYLY